MAYGQRNTKNGGPYDPSDTVLAWGQDNSGSYLFDDGTLGYVQDHIDDIDPADCYDEDGESIGFLSVDCWARDGGVSEWGQWEYWYGETMRDFCLRNDIPLPVERVPQVLTDALYRGYAPLDVFDVYDAYLQGIVPLGELLTYFQD